MANTQTATQASPVPQAQPSVPSSMQGGWASIAKMYDDEKAQVESRQAAMQQQAAPILSEIEARSQQDMKDRDMLMNRYDQQMHAVNLLTQRQRLITMNRAQVLRKTLPIIGLFALIGGALDGVTGAMSALGGGLAGLSQGMNKRYQEAWNEYNEKVKEMFDQTKDTQATLKSIISDDSKTLDEKLSLLKITGAHMPVYNQIDNSKANAYARWVDEVNRMDDRTRRAEAAHKGAQAINKRVTQTEVNDAMTAVFPFTPPNTQDDLNPSVTVSNARNAWIQKHHMDALQVATIAHDYSAKTNAAWPDALQHTINWLRAHHQLDAGNLGQWDDAMIEQEMFGGSGAPAGNARIIMAPGTDASVVRAVTAAAGANAVKDAKVPNAARAPKTSGKTRYVDKSGKQYPQATIDAAYSQAKRKNPALTFDAFVKDMGLSYITVE